MSDCTISCDFAVADSNQGIQARATNADYGVLVVIVGTALETYEVAAGDYNKISGTHGDGVDVQPGDLITVALAGTAISVLRNGVELYSLTSRIGLTRTKHGLRCDNTGPTARFANFKITTP